MRVTDEGNRFEGSIQTVWRYLGSGDRHAEVHRSERNHQTKTVGVHTVERTFERQWRGTWVKVARRDTLLPPLGWVEEFLEGPFAGSKAFTVYTPDGHNTRVDVYGEFISSVLPESDVEEAVRAWLEESFQEDAPAVKLLQESPDP